MAGGPSSYDSECEQLDTLAWQHKDLLMFRSAGNDNTPPLDSVNSPATAKNIVCVGANEAGFGATSTTWSNPGRNDAYNDIKDMAEFSSHGPTKEGLRRPHLLAQGGWYIWSAQSDGNLSSNNNGIQYMGGTSMACPTAAGLCALVRQYLTEGWYPTGTKVAGDAIANPSGALMKALMILSTRNSPGAYSTNTINSTGTANVPSQGQGWGSVVLNDALFFSGDARKLRLVEGSFSTTGQTATYTITTGASATEDFKVALIYFDYPSALSPMDISVNNLNLTVSDGEGNTYLGSVFASNGYSTTGGTADTVNPEEVVWLPAAAAKSNRTLTITVTAATINRSPQPYALVAGGDISTSTGFLGVSFSFMSARQYGNAIVVSWRTESEQDCYRWDIERSTDAGHGYHKIGSVPGHNTTYVPTQYSYTDNGDLQAGTYYYQLVQIDADSTRTEYGPVAVQYGGPDLPEVYQLAPCQPNPSQGWVRFDYQLPKTSMVNLIIYNIAGQVVKRFDQGTQPAGSYSINWNDSRVSAGIYFYRLQAGDFTSTKKLTIVK